MDGAIPPEPFPRRSVKLGYWLLSCLLLALVPLVWQSSLGIGTLMPLAASAGLAGAVTLLVRDWLQLRKTRRAYDLAMQAAHDGFWEWNPVTKKLHVGKRLLEILGYQRDFLADTHAWLALVHPDDAAHYNQAVSQHLKGKSAYFYCEYRVRAFDGAYRWIASRGIAVRDRHGVAYQMVGSVTDITERKRHQEMLEFMAKHDALTGLPNRLLLAEELSARIEQARQAGERLAIAFLDLDRFKDINDTLGHRAGDILLQEVSQRLQAALPSHCSLFRQGGDEFIILMSPIAGLEEAQKICGQLRELINAPFPAAEHDFSTSASLGISIYPDDADSGEKLLRHADTAMYEAKASGGNAIRCHTAQMNQRLSSRVSLESALRQALTRNELALHYQPKIDLATGRLDGSEALLRWQHDGRYIPPDQFIPIAEESGLIVPMGEWIIARAIEQLVAWRDLHGQTPPVAINLSPRQFWRPGLAQLILDKLAEAGLPHEAIEVEVTESVLLHTEGGSLEELESLRKAGIGIALDDFGTGYSSLSYLLRLPIDTLKIDRSFIREIGHEVSGKHSRALVRAIVSMAHDLSLKVVAEGVEDEAQASILRELGCDLIQGYLVAPALPAGEFSGRYLGIPGLPQAQG